ncbi:phage tail protein [Janthinobacterium sp. TB1-E2]|uniref:Phage tail protein n=1 Tax=Janthinobacterium aestuarii TaxID=2985511 RepID=A0ABZ2GU31_9BURK
MAAAISALQRNHDRLLVFADEGNVVALIAWLKVHQLDLMANEERRKHGIAFEVDFNNHETVDISIKLDLTERVAVKTGEVGRLDIKHLAEIQHMPAYADEFWKLYDGETLLPEWRTPEATP